MNLNYNKNNSLLKIFILIQFSVLLSYIFEPFFHEFFGSSMPGLLETKNLSPITLLNVFVLILITSSLFLRFNTLKNENLEIKFYPLIHIILSLIEIVFLGIITKWSLDIEATKIYRDQVNFGFFKVFTGFFYISTIILMFAFHKNNEIKNNSSKTYFTTLLLFTFLIWFAKDFFTGTRGSTINFILFYIASLTFLNPNFLTLKSLLRIKNIIIVIFISIIFLLLILVKDNFQSISLSAIYDHAIYKFNGNLSVAYNLIKDTYLVSSDCKLIPSAGNGADILPSAAFTCEFLRPSELSWFTGDLTKSNFYPIFNLFSNFFNSKVLNNTNVYFNIYDSLPFNSANFLFYVFLGGWVTFTISVVSIIFLRYISTLFPLFNLIVYCVLFHVVAYSFTDFSLRHYQFWALLILIIPFKKCILIKDNNEKSTWR